MSNAFPINNRTSYKKQSTEQSDKTDNFNKHSNLTQQSNQKETNYFSSSSSNHASFKENKNHSKYSSFVKEYKEGRDVKDKNEIAYREVKDTRQVIPKDLSNYNSTSGIVDNFNYFPRSNLDIQSTQSNQTNQPSQSQSTQINYINSNVTNSSHYKNSNNPNINDVYNNNQDSKMRSSVKQDSFKDKNTTTTTPKTKTKRNEKDREKENHHSSKREKEKEKESSSIISEADQALIIKMLYFFQTSKDKAFAFLFKNRDKIKNLARIIWYTPGIVTIFLQEIISMYSIIDKVEIKKEDILSSYNIISLFQLLVLDKEINNKVVQSRLLEYLLPFLDMEATNSNQESLILIVLGVFVVVLKTEDRSIIPYLNSINMMSTSVSILGKMTGSNLTLPLFMLQTMLSDKECLETFCERKRQLSECLNYLGKNVSKETLPIKLVKSIVKVYGLIVKHPNGRKAFSQKVPKILYNEKFYDSLDDSTRSYLDIVYMTFENNKKLQQIVSKLQAKGKGVVLPTKSTYDSASVFSYDTLFYRVNPSTTSVNGNSDKPSSVSKEDNATSWVRIKNTKPANSRFVKILESESSEKKEDENVNKNVNKSNFNNNINNIDSNNKDNKQNNNDNNNENYNDRKNKEDLNDKKNDLNTNNYVSNNNVNETKKDNNKAKDSYNKETNTNKANTANTENNDNTNDRNNKDKNNTKESDTNQNSNTYQNDHKKETENETSIPKPNIDNNNDATDKKDNKDNKNDDNTLNTKTEIVEDLTEEDGDILERLNLIYNQDINFFNPANSKKNNFFTNKTGYVYKDFVSKAQVSNVSLTSQPINQISPVNSVNHPSNNINTITNSNMSSINQMNLLSPIHKTNPYKNSINSKNNSSIISNNNNANNIKVNSNIIKQDTLLSKKQQYQEQYLNSSKHDSHINSSFSIHGIEENMINNNNNSNNNNNAYLNQNQSQTQNQNALYNTNTNPNNSNNTNYNVIHNNSYKAYVNNNSTNNNNNSIGNNIQSINSFSNPIDPNLVNVIQVTHDPNSNYSNYPQQINQYGQIIPIQNTNQEFYSYIPGYETNDIMVNQQPVYYQSIQDIQNPNSNINSNLQSIPNVQYYSYPQNYYPDNIQNIPLANINDINLHNQMALNDGVPSGYYYINSPEELQGINPNVVSVSNISNIPQEGQYVDYSLYQQQQQQQQLNNLNNINMNKDNSFIDYNNYYPYNTSYQVQQSQQSQVNLPQHPQEAYLNSKITNENNTITNNSNNITKLNNISSKNKKNSKNNKNNTNNTLSTQQKQQLSNNDNNNNNSSGLYNNNNSNNPNNPNSQLYGQPNINISNIYLNNYYNN